MLITLATNDRLSAAERPSTTERPVVAERTIVTPEQIRPFPQVRQDLESRPPRRNVGRTRILTSTPEKQAIEDSLRQTRAAPTERNKRKKEKQRKQNACANDRV